MAVVDDIYCVNSSEVEQPLRHLALTKAGVVPVAPGGYKLVKGGQVMIGPGQAFRIPTG